MIIRGKYLLINPETLVENGAVKITGETVTASGRYNPADKGGERMLDLGEAIIMPGLVNPHTHLEGPELYGGTPPLGEKRLLPPQSFTEWAEQVIAMRLRMKPDEFKKAVARGYERLIHNGITFVGDHTHLVRTWSVHRHSPIRRILLEEITDLNPLTAEQTFRNVVRNLRLVKRTAELKAGVAPHAAYTVSAELYRLLFGYARKQRMPFSTHLSELKEERELLTKGTGKIRAYLKRVGRDNYYWRPPGTTAVQYLNKLGILRPPGFFVHCNYLSNKDITILVRSGAGIVFCPNSHHYFGHRNHPFRKLMKLGVTVALGTDGLGSNEDLSILKEMKFIMDNYPAINPAVLFRMGTLNGLKVLGVKEKLGELRPGFLADLVVFPLKRKMTNPEGVKRDLIESSPKSILTMVAGRIIHRD